MFRKTQVAVAQEATRARYTYSRSVIVNQAPINVIAGSDRRSFLPPVSLWSNLYECKIENLRNRRKNDA